MRTRVLLLIYHLADGGAERGVSLWATMLADANYDVTVLTYYPRSDEYPLDKRVTRDNLFASYQDYLLLNDKQAACKKLLNEYLDKHHQDIIIPSLFGCNLLTATCNRIAQNRVIITQTILDSPWDKEQGFELSMRDWAIQKQGSVILQNTEQAEYFNTPLFKHVKKYVVHNSLNPLIEKIYKTEYHPIKKIVTAGRLASQKNHSLMIDVIRILREVYKENYELDIFGVGELQEHLQQQIDSSNLGNLVKLRGRSTDIFHELIKYDLFIMTSLHEGTPNALLEAMGLGLPSLAVKCRTGITELIQDNINGYVVKSDNPYTIAKRIHEINQPKQLEAIGKQARQDMLKRFTSDKIKAELVNVIENLLHNKPKTHRAIITPCEFLGQDKFQSYFEDTLYLIRNSNYQLGKQIFKHARHTLSTLNHIKISTSNKNVLFYLICLRRNQFKILYDYFNNND